MKERTTITVAAAACFVAALAVFNVAGWVVSWRDSLAFAALFAGVALTAEVLGFNLAISIERQWRDKRRAAALAAGYSLAVCMLINLASGHNAWIAFERAMFAPQVAAAQAEIDQRRARLLTEIAAIDQQIQAARPPVTMDAGPRGRAEARQVYELEIARLNPRRAQAQAALDAAPILAHERHVAPDWAVWALFAAIEAVKSLVLWAIGKGATAVAPTVAAGRKALAPENPSAPDAGRAKPDANIVAQIGFLATGNPRHAAVWRCRHLEQRSIAGIAARLNISERMARRLLREAGQRIERQYAANVVSISSGKAA